jgi:hypothetical protein
VHASELVVSLFESVDQVLSVLDRFEFTSSRQFVGLADAVVTESSYDLDIHRSMFARALRYCMLPDASRTVVGSQCTVTLPDGERLMVSFDSERKPVSVSHDQIFLEVSSILDSMLRSVDRYYALGGELFLPLAEVVFEPRSEVQDLRRMVVILALSYWRDPEIHP